MRLYAPLNAHMEFLANKQKLYEKFPKWWDFKQMIMLGGFAFLVCGALPVIALFKLGIMTETDSAIFIGFVLGIFFGMLVTTSLLDDILSKMVKDGRL